MENEEVFLQVSSRHIGQLGRELVTDYVTALTELIKNSYDADSEAVEIIFEDIQSENARIYILDTGSGFTREDIINKWAVIGTNSKVRSPYSRIYNRKCAGKKGIGRFSVERLAEYCTVMSINEKLEPIKYFVNWNNFEGLDLLEFNQRVKILENKPDIQSAKYIKSTIEYIINNNQVETQDKQKILKLIPKDVSYSLFINNIDYLRKTKEILLPLISKYINLDQNISQIPTHLLKISKEELKYLNSELDRLYNYFSIKKEKHTGTLIVLEGLRDEWKEKDIQKLFRELRVLISPFDEENNFHIKLSAKDYKINDLNLTNEILSLNYAVIDGFFKNDENKLNYTLAIKGEDVKQGTINFDESFICGDFNVKLYYFLRDNKLKSENLKIKEARNILDQFSGVKIYRDGFRVRPYGDNGNDWLLLDNKKIKDTHGYRVGNNQLIGAVKISSEGNPLLTDATNRESIIENEAFEQLRYVLGKIISIIETDRYKKYIEELNNDQVKKVEILKAKAQTNSIQKINNLYVKVEEHLSKKNLSGISNLMSEILETINDEREKSNKYYEDAKIHYEKKIEYNKNELNLYKNLATLGIFAGSFGHETDDTIARMLLNIEFLKPYLIDSSSLSAYDQLYKDVLKISNYSDMLIGYLKKSKRKYCNDLSIKQIINEIVDKYAEIIKSYKIKIDTNSVTDFQFKMPFMQIDIESIIINMITNSFEALKGRREKVIKISTIDDFINKNYILNFEDSGRGVPDDKKEWIFLPLNTTKNEDGVGLGLTIVKDVIESYKGGISVEKSDLGGAKFVISIPYKEN